MHISTAVQMPIPQPNVLVNLPPACKPPCHAKKSHRLLHWTGSGAGTGGKKPLDHPHSPMGMGLCAVDNGSINLRLRLSDQGSECRVPQPSQPTIASLAALLSGTSPGYSHALARPQLLLCCSFKARLASPGPRSRPPATQLACSTRVHQQQTCQNGSRAHPSSSHLSQLWQQQPQGQHARIAILEACLGTAAGGGGAFGR